MSSTRARRSEHLADGLEREGIRVRGNFKFASGDIATQKLDWKKINPKSDIYRQCVQKGSASIERLYGFGVTIVPIPNGANEYARQVAERLQIPPNYIEVFHKNKNETSRELTILPQAIEQLKTLENVVLVDDIFTTGSSLGRAKSLLGERVIGALVVWDRSDPDDHAREIFNNVSCIQVESLVNRFVPYY